MYRSCISLKIIKSCLLVSLVVAGVSNTAMAGKRKLKDVLRVTAIAAGATVLTSVVVAIKTWLAYEHGLEQCEILEGYRNTNNYRTMENRARHMYHQRYCGFFASSISLEQDHPAVWIEKDASKNKRWLYWMSYLSARFEPIVRRLTTALNYLRGIQRFDTERKVYNKELRKLKYRKDKLSLKRENVNIKREKLNLMKKGRRRR